jgi:DNA-binding response OmpR family regulator
MFAFEDLMPVDERLTVTETSSECGGIDGRSQRNIEMRRCPMGAMTLEKLTDMDSAGCSSSCQEELASGRPESRSYFWQKALIDELIPMLKSSDNTTERQELRPDDYRIAVILQENVRRTQNRLPQRVTRRDDVWVLPVTLSELVDRIRNEFNPLLLADREKIFGFGNIHVDFRKVEVMRSRRVVPLKPLEFKLLKYFAENSERVISRDELLDKVWGYHHYPSTRTIDNHVYFLRRKLEVNPVCPRHFVTVHGMGYKFVP